MWKFHGMAGVMSDSLQYNTARRLIDSSQYCMSMILQGDFLNMVWYYREIFTKKNLLTRQNLTKIENSLTHNVIQAGSNDERKKIGGWKSWWNVPSYRIWKIHMTPRSMILRGDWLCAVWIIVDGSVWRIYAEKLKVISFYNMNKQLKRRTFF